jgi:hypothetical protein
MTELTDPEGEATVAKANKARRDAARRRGRPEPQPIILREPGVARSEWCQEHAASMAVFWYLKGNDPGIESAVNYAAAFGAGIPALPQSFADAITARIDTPDRDVLAAAVAAIASRAGVVDRVGAEATLFRMCRVVAESLPDGARERLEQRLVGDIDFEWRCRRAASMFHVGTVLGREELRERGMQLALIECGQCPSIHPRVVFASVGDVIASGSRPDGSVDAGALVSALMAEWARAGAAMCWPDDGDGSADWSDVFGDEPGSAP